VQTLPGDAMDENAISLSVSDEEREFMDREIAEGRYSDEAQVLRAGLAALEREEKMRAFRIMISEADAQIERGEHKTFNETGDFTQYVIDDAEHLRRSVLESGRSGESLRQIPDIMSSVKAKLRANGAL
jgi:putative addiction module CopG family antidote